jgi:hypothetical protein
MANLSDRAGRPSSDPETREAAPSQGIVKNPMIIFRNLIFI